MADFGVQIIDHTLEVLRECDKRTNEALEKTGEYIKPVMKNECPKGETKALSQAIRLKLLPKEKAVKIILNSKKAFYAHIVIGGSVHTGKIHGKYRDYLRKFTRSWTIPPNNYPMRAIDQSRQAIRQFWDNKS